MKEAGSLSRRGFVSAALALAALPRPAFARAADEALRALERKHGGRLGVYAVDAHGRVRAAHRAGERFLLCSTFKLFLAAAVLEQVDRGKVRLDQRVPFTEADLLEYAPAVRARLADGAITVEELCRGAVGLSDNTAANLLLGLIGGPAGLTAWFRRLGDQTSRLDRLEPELNDLKGALDTTTPQAAATTLQRLITGGSLQAASRLRLERWLIESTTGLKRLRAGLPKEWRAGDKTGTGPAGETNDLAFVRPPEGPAVFVAAYYVAPKRPMQEREAVLARVGELVVQRVGG